MPNSSDTPAAAPRPHRLATKRLAELRRLLILDSGPETAYDDIVRLLAQSFNAPIAMVNLLDEDRDWFKASVGLEQTESPVSTSFCEAFFSAQDDIIIAEDTKLDPRFSNHPLVTAPPHIRFYASARLQLNGHTVGTLCCYDIAPKKLAAEQQEQLRALAQAAMTLLSERIATMPERPSAA